MLTRYQHASVADLVAPLNAWDWTGGRGVLLHGPPGTGKTHAAVALWKDYQSKHPARELTDEAPFVSVARLLQEKRRQMDGPTGWTEPNWKRARIVVLDDFDKARLSEWAQEELFTIIDTLYCRCVPVIVTSNLTPRAFVQYAGPYISDRLKEMAVPVAMDGPSRRTAPNASHANPRDRQPSPAHGDDARPSHQPEQVVGVDGSLASSRPALDGMGHRGTSLSEQEFQQAEGRLHLLLADAQGGVAR